MNVPSGIDGRVWETDEIKFENALAEEASRFESNLDNIHDLSKPKERALERRNFYSKQKELRQERARALGFLVKKKEKEVVSGSALQRIAKKFEHVRSRQFDAAGLEKTYHGPLIIYPDAEETDVNAPVILEQRDMISMLQYCDSHKYENLLDDTILDRMSNRENVDITDARIQLRKKLLRSRPVFLGEDGTLYDLFYRPVPNQGVDPNYRGKFSKMYQRRTTTTLRENDGKDETREEQFARLVDAYEYCHDPELYSSLPDVNVYSNFNEYERALLEWSRRVQRKLGYLQLPKPMGRHYYRPLFVSDIASRKTSSEDDENKSKQSIQDDIINSFSTESLLDEETWESHLIPLEPKPEFYATYEEYESAMLRWTSITLGLPFLPPHAAQFHFLLGLKIQNYPSHPIAGLTKAGKLQQNDQEKNDRDDDDDIIQESASDATVEQKWQLSNEWDNLSKQGQQNLRDSISRVLKTKQTRKKRTKACYHYHMLPKIHGQFDDEQSVKVMSRLDLSNLQLSTGKFQSERPEGVRSWIQTQRQERSLKKVYAKNTMPFLDAIAEELRHQKALRRTDLTEQEMIAGCDCEQWKQGRQVHFKIPEFDIGKLSFDMLKYQSYVRYLQILLIRMDYGHRYDHLHSWYHPSDLITRKYFDIMSNALQNVEHPSQVNSEHIRAIFLANNVYLDTFHIWLGNKLKEKIPVMVKQEELLLKTNRELLNMAMSFTTQDNFRTLLNLFTDCDDKLVHAKVSIFLIDFMKTEKALPQMQMLIKENDLRSLYLVATAVTFCDEVPIKLYEYKDEAQHLVRQIMDNGVDKFICDVMMFYYLNCICVSLLEEDAVYPYIYPLLIQEIEKNSISRVISYLQQKPMFLGNQLWFLLGHRSPQLSHLGRFLLSMLFFLSQISLNIKDLLKSDDTKLVEHIRRLSVSKLRHVQHAVIHIFPTLGHTQWRSLLIDFYSNLDNINKDLIQSGEINVQSPQPPLISSMVLEFMKTVFNLEDENDAADEDWAMKMIQGLNVSKGFPRILQEVLATSHQKRMHEGTIMGTIFLAKFAKYLICKSMIGIATKGTFTRASSSAMSHFSLNQTNNNNNNSNNNNSNNSNNNNDTKTKGLLGWDKIKNRLSKTNKRISGQQEALNPNSLLTSTPITRQSSLTFFHGPSDEMEIYKYEVSVNDLSQMLDFICQDNRHYNDRYIYRPRIYMLKAFRHLIKCPTVYNLIPHDQAFFQKILEICSDGQDIEFNRNAWRLFYQLIKYHSGTMEHLTKSNLMSNFLELIGTGKSSAVTTNSLYYFNKVFNLINKSEDNIADQPVTSKTKTGYNVPYDLVRRDYDKNLSKLCEYIQNRNHYLIFHLAFTNLSSNYKGWPFQSLANFYNTLNTSHHAGCQQMISKFKKQSKEFKDGMKFIEAMIATSKK